VTAATDEKALYAAALNAGVDLRLHVTSCPTCSTRQGLCRPGHDLVRASQAAWRAYRLVGGRVIP
jgi:sulfur relay (sulfurtransferase) complex TusBCD TusD component (DsrE family)